ncbi:MAG: 1-deoxy-D-xylulose-5-phosphate reductoisomerase [Eubacteriales bacterium]|nr:1-deoxy-D-xylulose-5-phosphate reductoisomerase [Eubacteriales bacterium]
MVKNIVILGSTGSIGTQTLDVIRRHRDRFNVVGLACGKNIEKLSEQIREFKPDIASCERQEDAETLAKEFPDLEVRWGAMGLVETAEYDSDVVLNSVMGMRGLVPTLHAIDKGRDIALANKETLVAGGSVVMAAVKRRGVRMLPVDSEHSAIFQCLEGNRGKHIKKILLTASGGPFRGWTREQLEGVTPEMALKHPNWTMGRKITIDSASMMNKGLEMIEAKWLFDVDINDIQVLVHPQSVIHSAVEYDDNSVIAQLGVPDMRVPISVALGYPDRIEAGADELDFFSLGSGLTFERPDTDVFGCLKLAKQASLDGDTYPAAMNAANEVLVEAFLEKRIGFTDIEKGVARVLDEHQPVQDPEIDDILEADRNVREYVREEIL